MADSYLFSLYIELREDLTPLEQHTLAYLFGKRPDAPDTWPAHDYFQVPRGPDQWGQGGATMPPGACVSAHWRLRDHPGLFSGVHITCPHLKLEQFSEDCLPLAQWLATLSRSRGYVGVFKSQSDDDGFPWVLQVVDGELHITFFDEDTPRVAAGTGAL